MAMMIHSGKLAEGKALSISDGCNGCVTIKNITFKGVSSHMRADLRKNGRNALYAATTAPKAPSMHSARPLPTMTTSFPSDHHGSRSRRQRDPGDCKSGVPMCAALPSTRSANTISRSTRHLPLPLPRSAATWSWMTIRAIPVKQR